MVEHFRAVTRHMIGGQAKAMVATGGRLHAVRYTPAFERYLAEHGYGDIRVLVGFSGEVTDSDTGDTYTEPEMDGGIRPADAESRRGPPPEVRYPITWTQRVPNGSLWNGLKAR